MVPSSRQAEVHDDCSRHIILGGSKRLGGLELLSSSVVAWVVNVASFALLFWQLDAGGPAAQAMRGKSPRDWLFPQAGDADAMPGWSPGYVDYLYLAFSTATAFSTTDAMPLTARAKMLMMLEASRAIRVLAN